jgi:hypothetical protein
MLSTNGVSLFFYLFAFYLFTFIIFRLQYYKKITIFANDWGKT